MDNAYEKKEQQYILILKQIFVSYFFNFLIILCQPLLTFLLTKALPIEEYGIYSLLFSTISILSIILRFGFVDYIRTKIPGSNEETRIKYITSIITFLLFSLFITALLLYLCRTYILQFLNIQKYPQLWVLSILLIIFSTLNDIINSYLTSIKKIFLSSIIGFFVRCLWILILALLFIMRMEFSINQLFIIWLAGTVIPLILTLFALKSEIPFFLKNFPKIDYIFLKSALRFSLPLILLVSLSFIIDSSNRYIINYYLGKTDLAIYSLASGLATTLVSIPLIFQSVIHPYFAERWNLKNDSSLLYNIMLKYSLLIALPFIIIAFVFRKEIILLIAGTKYMPATSILVILLLFSIFSILIEIFNKIFLLKNMIKHILIIYLIGSILNLTLNLIFVRIFGLIAAAYSTVTTYLFILITLFYYQPKEISIDLKFIKLIRILLASSLTSVIFITFNQNNYWSKIILIVTGILSYILLLFIFNIFTKEEKEIILLQYQTYKNKLF